MNNLIAPLTFEDGEIGNFIKRHVCALCFSHFVQYPAPSRKWYAKCPTHGNAIKTTTIRKGRAEQIKQDTTYALREIRK